jgi:hypothetical protein
MKLEHPLAWRWACWGLMTGVFHNRGFLALVAE